jgi:hypothetical protein
MHVRLCKLIGSRHSRQDHLAKLILSDVKMACQDCPDGRKRMHQKHLQQGYHAAGEVCMVQGDFSLQPQH